MLKITNLSFKTGVFRLSGINMEIQKTEYFVLLGPTGSGKTTFIKCLLGLNRVEKGQVFMDGREITYMPTEKKDIGFMPQNYMLFPNMNVYDNIAYGLKVKKKSPDFIAAEVSKISNVLGIGHILRNNVANLSGGETQRIALARALVIKPQLLLLDEPFSAIDQGMKNELWFEIKNIVKGLEVPVIHITHNLDEGYVLGDRLGIFIDGKLAQTGYPDKVFFSPVNEKVAKFLGINNIFEGVVSNVTPESVLISCGNITVTANNPGAGRNITAGTKIKFCVRPEAVKIIKKNTEIRAELAENVFETRIVSSHFFYDTSILKLKIMPSAGGLNITTRFPVYIYKRYNLSDGLNLKIAFWKPGIIIF